MSLSDYVKYGGGGDEMTRLIDEKENNLTVMLTQGQRGNLVFVL